MSEGMAQFMGNDECRFRNDERIHGVEVDKKSALALGMEK
jgi:hypothetical protein